MEKINFLIDLWREMFVAEWINQGLGPTELYERLSAKERDAYFEEAFRDGRIPPEEWNFINSDARIEGFEEAIRVMCAIYHRLGLLAPVAGREGGEA